MRVENILRNKGGTVRTVRPDTPLSDCVIQMADEDLGSLVVVEGGRAGDRLVGLLTFREVIRILARRQKELRSGPTPPVAELRVEDVMEREPLTVAPDVDLQQLRAMMIHHHQRYMPVLDGGRLLGVVSFHDVARSVYEEQRFENHMLKAYIRDWPGESELRASSMR